MPYTDFTELLLKIQEKNLGQGLIASAQAQMMMNQDSALRDTLAQFNKAKLDLEGGIKTTSEQLKQINESDLLQEGGQDLEKIAQSYTSLLALSLQSQSELRNLVESSKQRLINIGTPEALNQANSLSSYYEDKAKILQSEREVLPKQIEFVGNLLQVNSWKTNNEVANIKLKELKSDLEVMDRVAKVISYERVGKNGKRENLWMDVVSRLGFNIDTGELKSREQIKEFYKIVKEEILNDPNDAEYADKVIQALDLEISKRIKNYSPPHPVQNLDGVKKLMADGEYLSEAYNWLHEQSKSYAEIKYSPDYQYTRDLYSEYAQTYIKELEENGKKLTEQEKAKILEFGSSKTVIEKILNDSAVEDIQVIRTDNLPNTPKKALEYYYKTFVDKNNNEGYWKILDTFKKKINVNKIIPGNKKIGENGQVVYEANVRVLNHPIYGEMKFNLNEIMSDDAGFWNWYEVNMGKTKTYEQEVYDSLSPKDRPFQSTYPSNNNKIQLQYGIGKE